MIPVTKPYLPNREKLNRYIDGIYDRGWLTNNGPLVQELTWRLEEYLGVENLLLVANGTLALQVAYRALGVSGTDIRSEAITTPFSFIATASSLKWDGVSPIFADIDPKTWCLDPANIEGKVTPNTKAIVPVHVFGNACDVGAIDGQAKKHQLKVIYDASHAFGVTFRGESLLSFGDASTLSFHATKLFHTVEGGAIVFKHKSDLDRARKMINFGLSGPESIDELGINAKMNELQAAMGLCVLDELGACLEAREVVWRRYERTLSKALRTQTKSEGLLYNYAYFPVVFESEQQALLVAKTLKERGIQARRYFHPTLESVTCLGPSMICPYSAELSDRILCMPIYSSLSNEEVDTISSIVMEMVNG